MKILFWLIVAIDAVAVAIGGLLGLAAAGPSRTNPIIALLIPFFVPGAILLGAVLLFLRAQSTFPRLLAFGIAALPVLVVVGGRLMVEWELRKYEDATGTVREFRSEALRQIEAAIERDDAAAVAAAAPGADLNTPGISGATVLVLALRHLREPRQLDVVRALLAAGADPNATGAEPPLQPAIGDSRTAGIEVVKLLLDAGANPNARTEGGEPVFFIGGGAGIDVEVMRLLLDRGADVKLRDRDGRSAAHTAVLTQNWKVLRLLVERGAPWRDQKGGDGVPLLAYLEAEANKGTGDGLGEVLALLRAADPGGAR